MAQSAGSGMMVARAFGCPRCGGPSWWKCERPAGVYYSCVACGYVPERVHSDPEMEAMLRAEVEAKRKGAHLPSFIRDLVPAGREHQIRHMLAGVDRDIAQLRAIG